MGNNRKKKRKPNTRNITKKADDNCFKSKNEYINITVVLEEKDKLDFFHEILVLIVSLLHGTLFFILADKLLELINNFSIFRLSVLAFHYSLFLRIFQTHLLAAIKYTKKWVFKPMDFIMVFITALFEYILFYNEKIKSNREDWYYYSIFAFCLFGVIGYYITYQRTRKNYNGDGKRTELRIQFTNIFCILLVNILNLIGYFHIYTNENIVAIMNFSSFFIIMINIYISLNLSKSQLKEMLKME